MVMIMKRICRKCIYVIINLIFKCKVKCLRKSGYFFCVSEEQAVCTLTKSQNYLDISTCANLYCNGIQVKYSGFCAYMGDSG